MGKVCLKCHYERGPNDSSPDYECPRCGAVYAKVEAAVSAALPKPLVSSGMDRTRPECRPRNSKLAQCRTCGMSVSRSAKTCPHCGEKNPAPTKSGGWSISIGLTVVAVWLLVKVFGFSAEDTPRESVGSSSSSSTKASVSHETVVNSAWDGSVYQVERYLKRNLKDPDSYQGIEWSRVAPSDDGGYYVRHTYRAKNGFGGYVIENKVFYLSSQGNVLLAVPSK